MSTEAGSFAQPIVEEASDDEEEGEMNADADELFPGNSGSVIVAPRLSDDAPTYIEEADNESVVVRLEKMDVDTRVRSALVMNMYSTDANHYDKCMGPIALCADLMKKPKEDIALEFTAQEVASWNWTKETPKVSDLDYDQNRVMKAFYKAINEERQNSADLLELGLPTLKSWRHYIRLWRQGRQLYADFQHILPGKSFDEIQFHMETELGQLPSKPIMEERVHKLIEQFREGKRREERARNILTPATETVPAGGEAIVRGDQVIGSEAAPASEAAATLSSPGPAATSSEPNTSAASSTEPEAPISVMVSGATPTVVSPQASSALGGTSVGGKRRSLRVKASSTNTAGDAAKPTPKKTKRKSLTPSFTKPAKKPTIMRGDIKMVPPRLVQNTKGEDVGYNAPSADWVEAAMNKLVLLKNLGNYCSLQNIRGPRAVMDSFLDEFMGGGVKYDRDYIILMASIILDQMTENDEALYPILNALRAAGVLTPVAMAQATAKQLKLIVEPHDKSLNTAWMAKLCQLLVDKHDGLVPRTPQDLLAMGIKEISNAVANSVIQQAFGLFYGPVVDYYYGCRMAIALELIDLEEHHFDKNRIDADKVDPVYVRESLLSWLPQQEWKGFHTLLVSTAQMLVEAPNKNQEATIRKIIRKKFPTHDKNSLLGMVDSIIEYFAIADGTLSDAGGK